MPPPESGHSHSNKLMLAARLAARDRRRAPALTEGSIGSMSEPNKAAFLSCASQVEQTARPTRRDGSPQIIAALDLYERQWVIHLQRVPVANRSAVGTSTRQLSSASVCCGCSPITAARRSAREVQADLGCSAGSPTASQQVSPCLYPHQALAGSGSKGHPTYERLPMSQR